MDESWRVEVNQRRSNSALLCGEGIETAAHAVETHHSQSNVIEYID